MSRYMIGRFHTNGQVVVGYDPPFETFFGQVLRQEEDGTDTVVVWVGLQAGEIQTVDHLQALLWAWGTIPAAIRTQLEIDQRTALPPSPLQQRMRLFLEGL